MAAALGSTAAMPDANKPIETQPLPHSFVAKDLMPDLTTFYNHYNVQKENASYFVEWIPNNNKVNVGEYMRIGDQRKYNVSTLTLTAVDMFKDCTRMTEEISAHGLRDVGYGIPTHLFGAFVTGCVEVIRKLTKDDDAVDAFRWSLSLVTRILMRVINEGSTIVIDASGAGKSTAIKVLVGEQLPTTRYDLEERRPTDGICGTAHLPPL